MLLDGGAVAARKFSKANFASTLRSLFLRVTAQNFVQHQQLADLSSSFALIGRI
jgi:hypothetical protein